ncbi:MAG TPA: S41 family peptidase [Pyrinomonadaceae bacterium]|nr:S41 family peptidase [Pyrinomonadaceae bacterium]
MLRRIKDQLKKNYYDPKFRGMDLDARFKTAEEKIKTATSVGQIFGTIAQVLADLDDSHTFFIPPSRAYTTEYGWTMQIVGDRCFVSTVDKGSDAEAKGVKPGDEVLDAGGYKIDRTNLWKFNYLYNALRPQPGIRVTLRSPNGEPRELELIAKRKDGRRITDLTDYNVYMDMVRKSQREADLGRDRVKAFGDQLLIWKMNEFDLTDSQVDQAVERAHKYKALILDLRGNGGGWVTTVTRLLANLIDHDVKVGDAVSRKETKPMLAKTRGEKAYKGKLIVLVDSRSASASEVLSRTIQLEKRGTVIGDQTAGAVMTSRDYPDEVGLDVVVFYSVSITVSDLIMSDGSSLEHRGVTPDEVRLPTPEDLAAGRDTVLSYAASLFGVTLDSVEAGKLFPIELKVDRK